MRRSAMKKIFIGMTALALLVASPAPAGDLAPWLKSDTAYYFVGGQGIFRDTSWLLAWEGTIQGDVNGVIRWWVDVAEAAFPNYVGRWELLDCDYPVEPDFCPYDGITNVIMAGYSAGATVEVVDGIAEWSGKGVVTFVGDPQYAKWFGRRTTEGEWYNFVDVGGGQLSPNYGEGPFMIYDRPSNKH
jgi:hypothetical protein